MGRRPRGYLAPCAAPYATRAARSRRPTACALSDARRRGRHSHCDLRDSGGRVRSTAGHDENRRGAPTRRRVRGAQRRVAPRRCHQCACGRVRALVPPHDDRADACCRCRRRGSASCRRSGAGCATACARRGWLRVASRADCAAVARPRRRTRGFEPRISEEPGGNGRSLRRRSARFARTARIVGPRVNDPRRSLLVLRRRADALVARTCDRAGAGRRTGDWCLLAMQRAGERARRSPARHGR